MAENQKFYVKYLDNQAVGLKTHVLITATGQWVQNIFTVGDLIGAFQARPGSLLANTDAGLITLHLPEGVDKDFLEDDCFATVDETDTTLDPSCLLSDLVDLGSKSKRPLIIKSRNGLRSHSSSDEVIQEISPTSDGSPKRQKIDSMIEKTKKYLFRTERWGCVTIIKKRTAIIAHNEHRTLEVGNIIKIYSLENGSQYEVKVCKINIESDWVLLEAEIDLCVDEPNKGLTVDGRGYIQLGLSATTQNDSPFSLSKGVISSSRLNKFGHLLGSAGANPGDSGGPCFHESNGELIGMNVGCENVPINIEKDTGAQMYDKISSRYATRAHIIPVSSFQFV